MKKCPQCGREYDNSMMFCLDDGAELLYGPAAAAERDDPETAILHTTDAPADAPTRAQVHTTDQTAVLPSPLSRSFDKRLIAVPLILAIIIVGGSIGYRYLNSSGGQIESIAVMPFVNEGGNADVEYLSDGMTETLINSLSKLPGLSVKARSSVFTYKGKDVSPKQIAADLAVQAILNGRIAQRADQLVVSLELMDTATGNQIWGEQYIRRMTDLTVLQSDIARDVSKKLQSKLSGAAEQQVTRNYTDNTDAYQLYLRGKYHWNKRTGPDIQKSIGLFQQAIDRDPTYALAYSGLAEAYILLPGYAGEAPEDSYRLAKAAAQKALLIDPNLAEAHAALASVSSDYDWDFAAAENGFKKAIEINPNYATAHHWYGEMLLALDRPSEALSEMKKAQELDPLSLIINAMVGVAYNLNGQSDDAIAQLLRTVDMDPNFPRTHIFLSDAYIEKGMYEAAIEEYAKVGLLTGVPPNEVSRERALLLDEYSKSGPKGFFRKLAQAFENARGTKAAQPPIAVVASLWARAGDSEKALSLLEEGLKKRDPGMLRIGSSTFASLYAEPRYRAVVQSVGLPQRK